MYSKEDEEKAEDAVPMGEGNAETRIRMVAEEDITMHDLLPEDQAGLKMVRATDDDGGTECVCISMLGS